MDYVQISNLTEMSVNNDENNLEQALITEEINDCAMGPEWHKVYHSLRKSLKNIPEQIVRILILEYYGPPSYIKDRIYYLVCDSYTFIVPKCVNCFRRLTKKMEFYLLIAKLKTKDSNFTHKVRFVCETCWLSNMQHLFDQKLQQFELPKFGPNLVPENLAARSASLCFDSNWTWIRWTSNFGFSRFIKKDLVLDGDYWSTY